MPTIRVDGNDIFAIYAATQKAREIIITQKRPVLIEAMSYRVGDHSTSDYSAAYRNETEMEKWKELLEKFSNPISRLEKYLLREGVITPDQNEKLRTNAKNMVREALKAANDLPKPSIDVMFSDVYESIPTHIGEQKEQLRAHLKKYPEHYNLGNFKDGEKWVNS